TPGAPAPTSPAPEGRQTVAPPGLGKRVEALRSSQGLAPLANNGRPSGAKGRKTMAADLIDLVQRLGQPHVLVVGDLMLDRYVWGDAERISQEAPVILLRADKREERLGGASSVATMLRALGARVALAGVVGPDADGARIRQILSDLGIDHEGVVTDGG